MGNKERELKPFDDRHICLYCGNEEKRHWDEYTEYYECDCEDVKFNTEIKEQIERLQRQIRPPKFKTEKRLFLVPINK